MSSPNIESPYNAYSFHGDVTVSPTHPDPSGSPRNSSTDARLPPRIRFRSPDLFQHILSDAVPSDQSAQPPAINYEETMNDVNRALLSANRAIQNAQEAFQSRRSWSGNTQPATTQEVVDLTEMENSPPASGTNIPAMNGQASTEEAAYDAFLSRIIHPHDSGPRHTVGHGLLSDPSYGPYDPTPPAPAEDPTARYSGPDSLAGPQRRYQNQSSLQIEMQHMFVRSQQRSDSRDEQAAIRRQQRARAQWEQSQRRTNDRLRLEEQRQRLLNSPVSSRTSQSARMDPEQAARHRPTYSSTSSSSSIEAVDLTHVDDNSSLSQALSKQRQDAITSQNDSSQKRPTNSGIGDGTGRTALTNYKCPICMEVPQNATTTLCGHLFCHKCIIDTLKWSEQARRDDLPPSRKVKGVCPVCRKELARKEEPGPGRTLIPLELKFMSKKELKRKREEEELKARADQKGKEKVYDIGEMMGDEEDVKADYGEGSSSSQKENSNIKRVRTANDLNFGNDIIDDLFYFGPDEDF